MSNADPLLDSVEQRMDELFLDSRFPARDHADLDNCVSIGTTAGRFSD
ncbi:hypothetical protein ACH50O_06125 [Methylomonas sp. 2BW1-5-20]